MNTRISLWVGLGLLACAVAACDKNETATAAPVKDAAPVPTVYEHTGVLAPKGAEVAIKEILAAFDRDVAKLAASTSASSTASAAASASAAPKATARAPAHASASAAPAASTAAGPKRVRAYSVELQENLMIAVLQVPGKPNAAYKYTKAPAQAVKGPEVMKMDGPATPAPDEFAFFVDELDLGKVPEIIKDAVIKSQGSSVRVLNMEMSYSLFDTAPVWRVMVAADSKTEKYEYDLKGQRLKARSGK
jgi:hypothetical protein